MDDGVVNWGEHTVEEEESNHALMAINSNNEGPQEPKPSVSDDRSSEYSTCQSNDSAGSIGTSSEHSVDLESEISKYLKRTNIKSLSNKNTGRENVNSVRPNVNTGRENVNSVRLNVNTGRAPNLPDHNSFSPKRPQVNQLNQRRHFSKSHSPVSRPLVRNTTRMTYSHAVKGNWGTAVKTSAEYKDLSQSENAQLKRSSGQESHKENTLIEETQRRIHDLIADEDNTQILN
ncbi:hypothetical protein Tco_1291821 [Tanacetum coccineum]